MRLLAITMIMLVNFFATAYAQLTNCDAALVTNQVNWKYDTSLKLSILNIIDKSNFEEKRRQLSTGANLLVDGLPISGFANYEDFQQARSREFKKYEFKFDRSESAAYASTYTPPEAFSAYVDCLRIQAKNNYGLHIIPKEITADFAGIDIYWNPPPKVQPAILEIEITGGVSTKNLPTAMDPNTYQAINISRNKGEVLRLTASANGLSPERFVLPLPQISDSKQPYETSGYSVKLDLLAHVEGIGDVAGKEGRWVGSKGQSKRLEGFQIALSENVPMLNLEYMCHLEGIGDTKWLKGGEFCGTRGQSRRLEGFAIRTSGDQGNFYQASYKCHVQGVGDTDTYYGGQFCGTRGQSRRVEAIFVEVKRR